MKKLFLLILSSIFLLTGNISFAQESEFLPDRTKLHLSESQYDPVMKKNIIKDSVDKAAAQKIGTEQSLEFLLRGNGQRTPLMMIVNYIIGAIAILWFVVLGAKFIFGQGDEEKVSNYKAQFGWMILGLATIGIGEYVAFEVLFPEKDILGSTVSIGNLADKVDQIVLFFEIFVGGIMLISIMMSGYNLITGSEEDERIEQEKNIFQQFFIGAFLILTAEVFARIFGGQTQSGEYLDNPSPLASQGVSEVVGIINFVLTFVGAAALIMLILSSLYYVLSFGNEDQMNRAKRIIITCIIGIVITLSSYTFIRFMIA